LFNTQTSGEMLLRPAFCLAQLLYSPAQFSYRFLPCVHPKRLSCIEPQGKQYFLYKVLKRLTLLSCSRFFLPNIMPDMNVNRSEIFLLAAHFYASNDPGRAEIFYRRAESSAETECGSGSAVSGVVLIEFAQFLEDQGRLVEAQQCHARVRQILCHYAGQTFKLSQTG
jgi:hypothetical protein